MHRKLLCLAFVAALILIQVEADKEENKNGIEELLDENTGDQEIQEKNGTKKEDLVNPDNDENDGDIIKPKNRDRGEDDRDDEENEQEHKRHRNKDRDRDEQNERDDEPPLSTNRGLDFEPMKPEELKERRLKCVPGRTVVRMEQKSQTNPVEDDDDDYRRTHMNWQEDKSKEDCKICTCSIEGKDEHCSGRPARNLNECLVLARLSEELNSNMPFSHERELSNRIRRYGAQKKLKRPECIPFVSEYNDCSEYTTCRGCNQCRCSSDGHWVCFKKRNVCAEEDIEIYDDGTEDNVIGTLMQEMAQKERQERPKKRPSYLAPLPEKRERVSSSPVLGYLIAVLQ